MGTARAIDALGTAIGGRRGRRHPDLPRLPPEVEPGNRWPWAPSPSLPRTGQRAMSRDRWERCRRLVRSSRDRSARVWWDSWTWK